jgi:uncharacterized protein YfeS
MIMWTVIGIIAVTGMITEHLRKMAKIKTEAIRDEIELEKLKQQNYIIETEKMKLELEKMKLDYTPEKNNIMKI